MALYKISRGRDIKLEGTPSSSVETAPNSKRFALLPPDFEGLKFKLEVKEGDIVKIGSKLMSSRANPGVLFTSPAGGKVSEINRGAKRKLLEIVIEPDDEEEYEMFKSFSIDEIKRASREDIIKELTSSGMWPKLIQRPFSRVADPVAVPKSIFINAMETGPNCADKEILIKGRTREVQAGVYALKNLTNGKVFLCYGGKSEKNVPGVFNMEGTEINQFIGPHPSGNVGTHIRYLDPINKGDVVWHIDAEHLADIGKFLLDGRVPVERIVALAGSASKERKYYKTRLGASMESLTSDKVQEGSVRYINGGVLTGRQIQAEGYTGFYNSTITLLPEGGEKEILGWLKPGFNKPTFSRFFTSALMFYKKPVMDTKVNGERRAIVATHIYDNLVTLDVHTSFLIKACIAEDVEEMEALGILECAPEDFSLCTYACVSKVEVDSIIRQGLDLIEKEG